MKLLYLYIALLGANTFAMEPEPQPMDIEHPSSALLALPDELLMPIIQDAIVTIIANSATIEKAMEKINKLASVNRRFYRLVHDPSILKLFNKQRNVEEAKTWIKNRFERLWLANTFDVARIKKLLHIPVIAKYITQEYINDGRTALMESVHYDETQIAQMLLEKGADPNRQIAGGTTALIMAAVGDRIEIAQMLLEKGADPNIQSVDGWTALLGAAANSRTQIVQMLLENGADPNIQNHAGQTAWAVARRNNHHDIAQIIENYIRENYSKKRSQKKRKTN